MKQRNSLKRHSSSSSSPSDRTEGRAELLQQVHLQVNSAEREENTEGREPDEYPENLCTEVQRSQTAERETERERDRQRQRERGEEDSDLFLQ